MVLTHGRFAHNAIGLPAKVSVVHGEGDASEAGTCGRTTPLADRNFVFNMNAERNHLAVLGLENLAVGGEDQVIVQPAADVGVAALRGDEEIRRALGVQAQIEIHGQGGAIESRAQVSGGRRQSQADGTVRRCGTRRHLKAQPQGIDPKSI